MQPIQPAKIHSERNWQGRIKEILYSEVAMVYVRKQENLLLHCRKNI